LSWSNTLSPIIVVLIMFTYRSETVFSKLIAVRYLGGILELPTFWAENNYKYHGAVVKKLCERVCHLIQDVDIDLLDDINKHITSDTEGIDILGDAILVGTYGWIRHPSQKIWLLNPGTVL
jgi:hypothetical protein